MNILDFVMVGSNDYKKSSEFYDAILEPLKLKKTVTTEKYIGYSHSSDPDKTLFYVTNPVNGEPATFGNGTQITLLADSKDNGVKEKEMKLDDDIIKEVIRGYTKESGVRNLDGK